MIHVDPSVYDRHVAVGCSDIKNDRMTFRFREEVFEFPTLKVIRLVRWNGYFYEANIDDLRKLEAEVASG